MPYIKKNLKHINSAFIIKPYDPREVKFLNGNDKLIAEIHADTFNPVLPKCEIAILNSWELYDLKDNKKVLLDLDSYQPKNHYAKFDFNKLEDLLIFSDFELEIKQQINKSKQKFIKELETTLLKVDTDLQIKYWLNVFLTDIQDSIKSLNSLELNPIQKIVKTHYLNSYNESFKDIQSKYRDYLPNEDNSSLNKIILHNKINKLLTIESKLIEEGYISKSAGKLYWNSKRGYKVKLVNFCRLLLSKGYIKEYFETGKVIAYFEGRYNLNTGNQAKPSKFKESDKVIEGDFIFLEF